MAVRRHAPGITPIVSAAALMLVAVFLVHRLHPGGVVAAFRGDRPKPPPNGGADPAEVVAWGSADGVQLGVTLSTAGSGWLRILIRNAGVTDVMLASGLEPERSGRLSLIIEDKEAGGVLRGNALDPAVSFRNVLPPNETISLAVRLPELREQAGPRRIYRVKVAWTGPVERRFGVEIHGEEVAVESGVLYLSKPWPVLGSAKKAASAPDGDLPVSVEDTQIQAP